MYLSGAGHINDSSIHLNGGEVMSLGERIRAYRKKSGYNQSQLADMTGVHLNTVVRWENDKRIPNAHLLRDIAEALNVDITDLMEEGTPVKALAQAQVAVSAAPPRARAKKEPPRLTYWAEVVEEARMAVKRGNREELSDIRVLLERALESVENGCLALGFEAERLPIDVGAGQPPLRHGNAV